jgi:hypothetical protein
MFVWNNQLTTSTHYVNIQKRPNETKTSATCASKGKINTNITDEKGISKLKLRQQMLLFCQREGN